MTTPTTSVMLPKADKRFKFVSPGVSSVQSVSSQCPVSSVQSVSSVQCGVDSFSGRTTV